MTVDLTPKATLRPAEQELTREYVAGERPLGESLGGVQMFASSFKRGSGNKVFGSDMNGVWLGAADFPNAPFRVDMEGNVTATSATLAAYASQSDLSTVSSTVTTLDGAAVKKARTDQNLTGSVNVGVGNVKIDGANKRIIINDGTNDRILLGYQSGGF